MHAHTTAHTLLSLKTRRIFHKFQVKNVIVFDFDVLTIFFIINQFILNIIEYKTISIKCWWFNATTQQVFIYFVFFFINNEKVFNFFFSSKTFEMLTC